MVLQDSLKKWIQTVLSSPILNFFFFKSALQQWDGFGKVPISSISTVAEGQPEIQACKMFHFN